MTTASKLIHVAHIYTRTGRHRLFLRQVEPRRYQWFLAKNPVEEPTEISSDTIEEAIRLAARHWKEDDFATQNCGFRYTLPERDEHGMNALFYQMTASLSSSNGVYYDDELGNNCFVQNAPLDARDLWLSLKQEGRL